MATQKKFLEIPLYSSFSIILKNIQKEA